MPSFIFPTILPIENLDFESATYIWIWHADKIPPHIGISTHSKYYSLKVSGKDNGIDCNATFNLAVKKHIALILIKTNQQIDLELIKKKFKNLSAASPTSVTCLHPISEIFNIKCNQLAELLEQLSKKNELHSYFGLNLPENYDRLPNYSPQEITNRLTILANVSR